VDLEADLGIDSVKQMQVLGMIKERHGFDLPEDMDMKGMRTICEVADSVRHLVASA
jgi:acyl carrier protein